MNEYKLRKATETDIPFLANAIIAAQKGNSDLLNYSTLFNLTEQEVNKLIIKMFGYGIDGCEFSLNSYWVVEYNKEPVATVGAWVERLNGSKSSNIIKSNLINFTFKKESLAFLKTKLNIIKDIVPEREANSLQIENLYVNENHRGQGIPKIIFNKQEKINISKYSDIKKIQLQVYANNTKAIKAHVKNGYKKVKSYKSENDEIFNYLPFNELLIMEKKVKK